LDRVRHAELSALHLHRLKTPLAMIKLRCDLMRLRPGLSEALCGDLMEQSEEVELLAAHMEQCQRLFRSPGDGRERTRGQLGPAWLEGHVEVFAELLAGQGRRLSLQLCETAIRADPEALRLALGALLENAQRHATGDVLLSTHARGDRMALTVADQGPGLPPSVLENLAPPWTWILRADAAPRRGLGLPLLLALTEAEGWGLRFRSSGRSGLRVTLDLHPGTVASELQGDGESLRC
jgi:signal transduction histidine kinase